MGALRRLFGLEPGPLSAAKAVADGSGVMPVGWHVDDGRYVDEPVPTPTGGYTTAWSNGVHFVDPGVPLSDYATGQVNVARIWRTQPNVRKVVDFIARNVASTPLHLHERVSDTDRRRVVDHPLADLLSEPQARTTPLRFWRAVISDGLLYDRWATLKVPTDDGSRSLLRIPARRFQFDLDSLDQVVGLKIYVGRAGEQWRSIPLDDVVYDFGYAPEGAGLTPMQTLADILAESAEAVRFRRQVWKNGARIPMWLEVPVEAVEQGFDDARFDADWKSRFTGDGPDAGGAPTLKDGIKAHEMKAFSAQDMQDIEGRRLTAIEVASAYHIAPELVGARQGNYSNVREYRSMLYRDSLGPYIVAWEQAINTMLLPDFEDDRPLYVEANIEAKLRGSFEDQAKVMQSATGAPWMTRNEARALQNRKPLPGGDELVVPLNVFTGNGHGEIGTAPGPTDAEDIGRRVTAAAALIRSGFAPAAALEAVGLDPIEHLGLLPVTVQKPADVENVDQDLVEEVTKSRPRVRVKTLPAEVRDRLHAEYHAAVAALVERQRAAVTSALGAKSTPPLAEAWDADRWQRELAAVVFQHTKRIADLRATETAAAVGLADFDTDVMLGWLVAAARTTADGWNAATYDALTEAVRHEDWKAKVADVFAAAAAARAVYLAVTSSTDAGNFGASEAAVAGGMRSKTWVTTSGNPRSSHAALGGQQVPVSGTFSNGARWPGDAVLPEAERANCKCVVEFSGEDS